MPTIQDIMAKKKAFEEELAAHGEAALKEEFKKFFDAHPEIEAVRWVQYTPYFADGDPCEFGVGEFTARLVESGEGAEAEDEEDEEDEEEDENEDWAEDEDDDDESFDYVEGLSVFKKIDEDFYETVFGDHCKVTATRDGFEVVEYEHE